VFENRVLKKVFGAKRNKVTREWRNLHNEEFSDLFSSPNIIWMIKWRRIRWVGHWHIGGRGEEYTGFWWGNLREKEHLDNPGVDGRIISRWIFRK
jgi:hypothetical protein